jgi:hypothetical protein
VVLRGGEVAFDETQPRLLDLERSTSVIMRIRSAVDIGAGRR